MFEIDIKSRKSIYEQIIDGVKSDIVSGFYKPGSKLPSVRDLSSRLTVNPNTIQKAYRELDSQKWIYTVSGLGCFVCEEERPKDTLQIENLFSELSEIIKQLNYLGVGEPEIIDRTGKILKNIKGGEKDDYS